MYLDAASIINVYFIRQKETFNLKPMSFKIDFNFENKKQRNLKGDIIGTLKTFKSGTLSLSLKADDFFELPSVMLDSDLDFYINYVSEDSLNLITDKIKATISSIKFEGDEDLRYFMEFEILDTLYRKEQNSEDFIPLFNPNSTYFIKNKHAEDSVKIKIQEELPMFMSNTNELLSKNKIENLTVDEIEFPFLTHLAYSNKADLDLKKFDMSSIFDIYPKGVNCGVLEIGTIIYNSATLLNNEIPMDKEPNKKNKTLKTLMNIFENNTYFTFNSPIYSLSIENELINTLNILDLNFILADLKAEYKNNSIELKLTLIENRLKEINTKNIIKTGINENLFENSSIKSNIQINREKTVRKLLNI